MSEYITVETRPTEDANILEITTNQPLTDEHAEVYRSFEEGDVGSPIAQMLFNGVAGIQAMTITEHTLLITRESDTPWEAIVDEVRDALRDFFL
ncbi:MAG: NifU N-terminal domain-containing protein [Anaerolineaceae bacterium]|nr:NifU N-terminal domain-containing protein [Anaerolineaceae bacterium]